MLIQDLKGEDLSHETQSRLENKAPKASMTPLRQRLLADMRTEGWAEDAQERILDEIARLAKHFGRSPDLLSLDEVREYLNQSSHELSWANYRATEMAIKFFFTKTVGRRWPAESGSMLVIFAQRPEKVKVYCPTLGWRPPRPPAEHFSTKLGPRSVRPRHRCRPGTLPG